MNVDLFQKLLRIWGTCDYRRMLDEFLSELINSRKFKRNRIEPLINIPGFKRSSRFFPPRNDFFN